MNFKLHAISMLGAIAFMGVTSPTLLAQEAGGTQNANGTSNAATPKTFNLYDPTMDPAIVQKDEVGTEPQNLGDRMEQIEMKEVAEEEIFDRVPG